MMDFSFRKWLIEEAAAHPDNEIILNFLQRAQSGAGGGAIGMLKKNLNNPEVVQHIYDRLVKMLYDTITSTVKPDDAVGFKYSPLNRLTGTWSTNLEQLKSSIMQSGGNVNEQGGWFNMFCTPVARFQSAFDINNEKVHIKSYFRPNLGGLDSDPRQMAGKLNALIGVLLKIYNAACHVAKKTNSTVAVKVPSSLETLLTHKRPMVAYFSMGVAQKQLEPAIENLLRSAGLESTKDQGFDIGNQSFDEMRAKQVVHDLISYIMNNNGMLPPKAVYWMREKLQQRGLGSAFDINNRMKDRSQLPQPTAPAPKPQPVPQERVIGGRKGSAKVVLSPT